MSDNSLIFFDKYIKGKRDEIYDYQPIVSEVGDFKRLQGIDVIINLIRNLLLTPLGSYPFDPNYGSLLYQKLFEQSDETTKNEIIYECKDRIAMYIPKVTVKDVDVTYFSDTKGCKVDVHIEREDVKGTVSLVLPAQQTMFGLEDIPYERIR